MGRRFTAWLITLLLPSLLQAGCYTVPTGPPPVWNTAVTSLRIPIDVERLAVLYPRTYNREWLQAYARLAGATFQLKERRPALRIVERFDLPTIRTEQTFQLSGIASDDTAVRVGRLLGADSVLLYQIDGPSLRDRLLAKLYGDLPPFQVTSKIIRAESAEVVYHNVVSAPVAGPHRPLPFFLGESWHDHAFQAALDRGIARTIADLHHAFR